MAHGERRFQRKPPEWSGCGGWEAAYPFELELVGARMIFWWTGRGYLALLSLIGVFGLFGALLTLAFGEQIFDTAPWLWAIGAVIAAVVNWLMGCRVNRKTGEECRAWVLEEPAHLPSAQSLHGTATGGVVGPDDAAGRGHAGARPAAELTPKAYRHSGALPNFPSFPPLWREPLVQPTVRCLGALARHISALAG
jgi:hypothetical protein